MTMPARLASDVFSPPADLDADLVDLLGYACQDLPPYTRLISDYIVRRDKLGWLFSSELARARRERWQIRTFTDQAGMALWAEHAGESDDPPVPDPSLTEILSVSVAQRVAEFEQRRYEQRRRAAPRPDRLVHLRLLVARFQTSARPVESALLTERCAALDRDGITAYADLATPGVEDLLTRHGFRPVAAKRVLPGNSDLIFPMVRKPSAP